MVIQNTSRVRLRLLENATKGCWWNQGIRPVNPGYHQLVLDITARPEKKTSALLLRRRFNRRRQSLGVGRADFIAYFQFRQHVRILYG
jgi:hypothetical protein